MTRRRVLALGAPMYQPIGRFPVSRRNGLDGEENMLALGCFIDALIVDPAPPVIDDVAALTRHRLGGLRVTLERHADGIDRRDHLSLGEDAHQTPETDTTTVFVGRLHIEIARALECGRHEKVGQARLGDVVAVQHAALATLLIVDDEIEGKARPTGPTRVRRLVGIADEIARIAGHQRRAAVMPMSLSRGEITMLPSDTTGTAHPEAPRTLRFRLLR